ncbi:MAG: glutamate-1-semialdehyde 2,1-aminomutase [Gammaproteobacteria bacterium]
MTGSADLFARALAVTPGGVHSPVRAFGRVGGTPVFVRAAQGSRIEDVDGRRYVDFCMAFGPLILGHAHPRVLRAVNEAATRGWSFGAAEAGSLELAELITGRLPWVERLRFVNSGTEAVMSALRLARAATGRSLVLKFEGCYHGHVDSMLIRAGSGLAGTGVGGVADSAGVTPGVAADTLVLPLDDGGALENLFAARGAEIAAAIIEPLPANHGLLPQRQEFLDALAWQCQQNGVLLIFDEVITGFRTAFGGMAEITGIRPDLVTYGKIVGGGFPVGAFGGRREVMELIAPLGPVYQAGTLSANPVAMAAGLATLRELADGTAYLALEDNGQLLDHLCRDIPGVRLQRFGSLFWIVADAARPADIIRTPTGLSADAVARFPAFFHALLAAGIYLAPSPYEVGFLSTAHTDDDIRTLATAARKAAV